MDDGAWRGPQPAGSSLALVCGARRYLILELGAESCLIDAPDEAALRGRGDIFDGERHVAGCLIRLTAPEGEYRRCFFRRGAG